MLVGNLGRDPELEHVGDKKTSVTEFSLATSEYRGGKTYTEWHTIKVFGKQAEACVKYLKKGRKVAITGRNSTRSWEKDGVKHYRTQVIADKVEFLSMPKDSDDADPGRPVDESIPPADNVESMPADDDLPF